MVHLDVCVRVYMYADIILKFSSSHIKCDTQTVQELGVQ